MSSTIFRQYDKRWGSLPYPTKNSSFSGNGCGCCSVTHLAIENPKYTKLTPKDVRKFMVKYAVSGKGTLWSGIPAGLKHYGYKDVVHIDEADPMSKAFKYIKKGYTMGVILFSAGWGGTTSKVYWTGGGHYIAFNKVKNVTNSDAYFYMKDSGGRKHDGWYSYHKSMKNRVYQMWLVKPIKAEKPKKKPKTANEKCIDGVIAFAKKYEADNSYKYKKWTSDINTHRCPICHPDSGKGWNCIGFVSACFHHGGGVKSVRCNNAGLGNNAWFDRVTADKWRERNGKDWLKVKTPKRGDVIICYSKGKYVHTALYIGNGYIIDATSSRGIKKRSYTSLAEYSKKFFRYTGKGKY